MTDATKQINPDTRDRLDLNARAALAVLEMARITPELMVEPYRKLGALMAEAAYDIAYAMEAERGKRLERDQVVETVGPEPMDTSWLCWPIGYDEDDTAKPTSPGMVFPVRVFGYPPHDGLLAAGVGSTESLERITSAYQLGEIGFFVRDNNNVDWIPDGPDGYKRREG